MGASIAAVGSHQEASPARQHSGAVEHHRVRPHNALADAGPLQDVFFFFELSKLAQLKILI